MEPVSISMEEILQRVPERARTAYTAMITQETSLFDSETGWSSFYLTQAQLAEEMEVCLRTVNRAVADLKKIGVVRIFTWPGAATETQVRVADVEVRRVSLSPFGPVISGKVTPARALLVEHAVLSLIKGNLQLLQDIEQHTT